jgi:hypothetical protein
LDVGDDAKPPLQGGSLGATPQGNPLNIDPLLETTPPPGKPRDTFGIGTAPEYEELGSPQLGQTLIVYHPFAGHPPEIVNTANLTWTREFDLPPPSEEPWAPFKTRADFEQAELFLHHNCTDSMINDQLQLNQRSSPTTHTMKNAHQMHKILAEASQHQDTSSVCFSHLL